MNSPSESSSVSGGNAGNRKRYLGIPLALGVALLIYIASPYFSFWRFTEALRDGDANALASHVDFPRVRESIKKQLRARLFPPSPEQKPPVKKDHLKSLIANLAPSFIDQIVDSYLTPDGLAQLIANPEIAPTKDATAAGSTQDSSERTNVRANVNWSQVRYAFFTTPRDFLVDLKGTKLRFRFYGLGWRLRKIELPLKQAKNGGG